MDRFPARPMLRFFLLPFVAVLVAFSSQAFADPEHHGRDLYRPYRDCAACHGDNLEGADYGTFTTPSCFECHDAEWDEGNLPPVVDAGGPYSVEAGEALVVDASASTDPEGDSLTYIWDFGDGHPRFRRSFWPTATHSYDTSGTFTGSLAVSDGYNPPVVVPFTVEVNEVTLPPGDAWSITTTESPPQEFVITIEDYDGSLLVLKDDGVNPTKMAIGVELSGVIFWMDVGITPFGGMSWASGSTYFANINRRSGVMAGIVISNAGGLAFFNGQKL